jgi:hypothetical protein
MILTLKKSTYILSAFAFTLIILGSCSENEDSNNQIEDIYLNIPDNNFEEKLIKYGIDSDGTVNQQMLRDDAEKITRLDLNLDADFDEIKDLTGIEGFVNLTFLSAANQEIKTVDLSFNTKLDTVYLLGNYLTNIDLSKNTNLIFVDLQVNEFDSNSTISGLENASNLKDLDLSWNYLEEFSIHNKSLEILHISHNDLKSIDTHGAINLNHIYMPSNKLEIVDFSTNVSLETLLLTGNKLQSINLENNPNLSHLYITGNLLTHLDVSNNQELIDLRIEGNTELSCIKIGVNQEIPSVWKSDYQQLNVECN